MGATGFDSKDKVAGFPVGIGDPVAGDGALSLDRKVEGSVPFDFSSNNRMIGFADTTVSEMGDHGIEQLGAFRKE